MRALVTGAGGFVGSELVRHLISKRYFVKALVRQEKQVVKLEELGAQVVLGDLKNQESILNAVKDVDVVFHIAALFRQAGLPDSEYYKINVEGTKILLDSCVNSGIKKFIHCSTVGVHGDIESPPGNELSPFSPGDIYQKTKLEAELLVSDYFNSSKISGSIIRPAMIYGPNDTRTLKLFRSISKRRFFYVGKGDALVHFIDVRDLAIAFRLAAEVPEAKNETFIIAGKSSLPLSKLVSIISALLGVDEPWLHLPVKPMQTLGSICEAVCTPLNLNPPIFRRRVDFFTKNRHFASEKAQKLLNFKPSKTLVEELVDIINSYIDSGLIGKHQISKPAAILRTIDGSIKHFDEIAQEYYGWDRDLILGKSTHDIFDTIFPENLEKINNKVIELGKWRGVLLHTTKDKKSIAVDSKWLSVPNCDPNNRMILEVNKLKTARSHTNLVYLFSPEILEMLAAA